MTKRPHGDIRRIPGVARGKIDMAKFQLGGGGVDQLLISCCSYSFYGVYYPWRDDGIEKDWEAKPIPPVGVSINIGIEKDWD